MAISPRQNASGQSSAAHQMLYLPDTMSDWPWPRVINPHWKEIQEESDQWFRRFNAFTERSQAAFDMCDFGRLASLFCPYASREYLRTGCDLMKVFFIVDEYTDVEPAPVVREMVDIVIDALTNPHKTRPQGEIILGQVTKEFWERALKITTPSAARNMVESLIDYLESVVVQAEDRDINKIRTIEEYTQMRRENVGGRPTIALGALHLDLPDEVLDHPMIREMEYLMSDLVMIDNDILSYNREQASGQEHYNILTVVMHERNTDFDGAMAWLCKFHKACEAKFLTLLEHLPSFGAKVDSDLREYIQSMANFPRGHYTWCFEGGRYFGNSGLEVQKTRMVPLLPKFNADQSLRQEQVVIAVVSF